LNRILSLLETHLLAGRVRGDTEAARRLDAYAVASEDFKRQMTPCAAAGR
jgi:hypothetical protein